MELNAPIGLVGRPQYAEGSALASARDTRNNSHLWKKGQLTADGLAAALQPIQKLVRQMSKQRRTPLGGQDIPETQNYYPFKIYKPDLNDSIFYSGYFVDLTAYQQSQARNCPFTIEQPTNLDWTSQDFAINPSTDWWRVWGVCDGLLSLRPFFYQDFPDYPQTNPPQNAGLFGLQVPLEDYSVTIPPQTYTGTDAQGFDYGQRAQSGVDDGLIPIILGGELDTTGETDYNYALWIEFDLSVVFDAGFTIYGTQFDTGDNPFPPGNSSYTDLNTKIIPLGIISNAGSDTPYDLYSIQVQYGNAFNLYGNFVNFNPGATLVYSAGLNYRGDWDNDPLLSDTIFYPGDVVKYQKLISFNLDSTSVNLKITDESTVPPTVGGSGLYVQCLYMMTDIGFTDDPTTDPNWVEISGATVTEQTDPTPNT